MRLEFALFVAGEEKPNQAALSPRSSLWFTFLFPIQRPHAYARKKVKRGFATYWILQIRRNRKIPSAKKVIEQEIGR